jgi:hypothetical protein
MDLRNVDSTAYIYMVPSSKNRIHVSIEPSWKFEIFEGYDMQKKSLSREQCLSVPTIGHFLNT